MVTQSPKLSLNLLKATSIQILQLLVFPFLHKFNLPKVLMLDQEGCKDSVGQDLNHLVEHKDSAELDLSHLVVHKDSAEQDLSHLVGARDSAEQDLSHLVEHRDSAEQDLNHLVGHRDSAEQDLNHLVVHKDSVIKGLHHLLGLKDSKASVKLALLRTLPQYLLEELQPQVLEGHHKLHNPYENYHDEDHKH